jgi:peptide deformylase
MDIVVHPDPRLGQVCRAVQDLFGYNPRVTQIARDLLDAAVANNAIGLAAPQIGYDERIIVVLNRGQWLTMVNPVVVDSCGQCVVREGCVSCPGFQLSVTRARTIRCHWLALDGQLCDAWFSSDEVNHDIVAQCVQHEIDHLDGITLRNTRPT